MGSLKVLHFHIGCWGSIAGLFPKIRRSDHKTLDPQGSPCGTFPPSSTSGQRGTRRWRSPTIDHLSLKAFFRNEGVSLLAGHSAPEIWDATLGQLLLRVTRQNYDSWLKATTGLRFEGTTLIVSVPNDLTADWLSSRMRTVIRQALTVVAGGGLKVAYEVASAGTTAPGGGHPLQPSLLPRLSTPLNPRFTFDRLLEGDYNRIALATARDVVENPDSNYSPLFITGPSGTGKTHLLHAIGHLAYKQGLLFVIVSADQFLSDFTTSVRDRAGAEFRARYRDVDLLLVDDVHALVGKKATQQELFMTIASLHDRGRRVVVTGDLAASTCGAATRFQGHLGWGMVATIEHPSFEDRASFVSMKARSQGLSLPPEVVQYLALRIRQSTRDLEGAVNRVIALGRITSEPMTIDLAAKALQPVASTPGAKELTVQPVFLLEAVCRHLSVDPRDLSSPKRERSLTYARHIAMYLLRQDAGLTYSAIARLLGKKDHSTVVHACTQLERELKASPATRADIDAIRNFLRNAATAS